MDYLNSLKLILQRFVYYNYKLKNTNCKFGYQVIKVLRNIIHLKEYRPIEECLNSILKFPTHHDIKKCRRFLGLASYLRRFISDFNKLAKSLTDLTKR